MQLYGLSYCASVSLFFKYVCACNWFLFVCCCHCCFCFEGGTCSLIFICSSFQEFVQCCMSSIALFQFFREVTPLPQKNRGSNLLKQKHPVLELTMWTNKRSWNRKPCQTMERWLFNKNMLLWCLFHVYNMHPCQCTCCVCVYAGGGGGGRQRIWKCIDKYVWGWGGGRGVGGGRF